MKRARREAVVPPTLIAGDLPPTTGSANTMTTPVNATANPRRAPPENIARMRDRIRRALLLPGIPVFSAGRIPSAEFNPSVNAAMRSRMAERDAVEGALNRMALNEEVDGARCDPPRDYDEAAYQRLRTQLDTHDRSLWETYARYLDWPSGPYQAPAGPSANMAMTVPTPVVLAADALQCPYVHIAEMPRHPITTPNMVVIQVPATTAQALFARMDPTATEFSAIADSGASHVLFKASSAHVLCNVKYSRKNDPPFAILKAANHGVLTAIGRGFLSVAGLRIESFIFPDDDLANNLLGLVPFANLGCTGVFKPYSFHIFKGSSRTAILSGSRKDTNALWRVPLESHCDSDSDGIPPPAPSTGLYIEANAVSIQDNASYVRFVHACLGYPSPTTFLRAVSAGYITGPDQFPRLTAKMVRRHLPNSLATAKGHLDRTRSNPPHALFDAVSARRRHHAMTTRGPNPKDLGDKKPTPHPPFDPTDGPRSATLHLDYTGPLPDATSSGTRYFQVSFQVSEKTPPCPRKNATSSGTISSRCSAYDTSTPRWL